MASDAAVDAPDVVAARGRRAMLPEPVMRALPVVALILAAALPIVHDNDGDLDALANALAYAALALGLNVVVGFAGLLDLGYAAFFAIGAYAYGILSSFQVMPPWSPFWEPFAWLGLVAHMVGTGADGGDVVRFTVSFWLMLPGSALIAAFFGILFGAPTLRLRGDYLAIVTLGFGEIVPIIVRNWPELTNGAQGLNGIAAPSLFGTSFGVAAKPFYWVGLALVAGLIVVSVRLRDSRTGRAWMAIREDELAASASGVDLVRLKLLAFAVGAGFAGMTGTYFVAKLQTATPDMFGYPVSVMVLVMVVLGGIGSVWGVVVGALAVQLLQSTVLREMTGWIQQLGHAVGSHWLGAADLTRASELIFGFILVGMMLFRRGGLIPAARRQSALTMDQQRGEVRRGAAVEPIPIGVPAALSVRGLHVQFGGLVALDGIDLDVPAGGVVAVIGPNGSGKSTLFNAITGLVSAQAGSVTLDGQEMRGLAPHRICAAGIARTFQNIRLFPTLAVIDNVLVGEHSRLRTGALGAVLRLPAARREEAGAALRARDILALFGNRLLPRLAMQVGNLSYANRRRVEIARALASRPRILLLDEPTAGMNPAETLELAEQVAALRGMGLTILLIEHKLDVVTRLADEVVVLDHGAVIARGTAEAVRRDEAVLRAYLGRDAQAAMAGAAAGGGVPVLA